MLCTFSVALHRAPSVCLHQFLTRLTNSEMSLPGCTWGRRRSAAYRDVFRHARACSHNLEQKSHVASMYIHRNPLRSMRRLGRRQLPCQRQLDLLELVVNRCFLINVVHCRFADSCHVLLARWPSPHPCLRDCVQTTEA